MKFEELKFEDISDTHGPNAIQAMVDLENGLSISVVRHSYSYGNEKGLFEIGAFWGGYMIEIEEWGDQVKGWLTKEDVEKEIDKASQFQYKKAKTIEN